MAYLDLSGFGGQASASAALVDAATFSPLEWQVVALARRDRLSSLVNPSRWAQFLALFFGGDRASPRLADSKLEALRRIAVLTWRNGAALPEGEINAFHAAGYSPDHLALVIDRIGQVVRD
ncbi:hypothetical protein [Sphingomonas sp. TDK1]|uniref:hypothetical protein n=1 Tax=Sphingomonas sp. TDK1 TaxID=453247 RepID=UPI0007D94321|nr:hypothetical protein [Sphingomonas sp. TDK1]OAN62836.1 hypothetical protein A7X12_21750 [Sphingomonas sp. TDK1]